MRNKKAEAYIDGEVRGWRHKKLNETGNMLVTISGGRSSATTARTIQIMENGDYSKFNKLYVFANTGLERPETIDFLKNIEKFWGIDLYKVEGVYSEIMGVGVRHKLVDYKNLNMEGVPFREAIKHKNKGDYSGLPHKDAPYCSEMTKTLPSKSFADDIFGVNNYVKVIGYRREDMPRRITFAEVNIDKDRIFPLLTDFDFPFSQINLNHWWENEKFKLGIHGDLGNCELCWKKGDKTLVNNILYGTRFIDWTRDLEREYGDTMFRGNRSIDDLVRLASMPITGVIDFGKDEDNESCVCNF